jgi:hypothetical protein
MRSDIAQQRVRVSGYRGGGIHGTAGEDDRCIGAHQGSRTELSSQTGQPRLAQTDRLAAMTTALIRLCERVSDRGLMFGLVWFVIGLWVGPSQSTRRCCGAC